MDTQKELDIAINGFENAIKSKIDTQVIIHLLVDKGIVSKEEVKYYREGISQSDTFKPLLEEIKELRKMNSSE